MRTKTEIESKERGVVMITRKIEEKSETKTVTTYEVVVAMPLGLWRELRENAITVFDDAVIDLETGHITMSVSVEHAPEI